MTDGPGGDRRGSWPGAVAPLLVAAAVPAWLYAWWAVGRPPFSDAATAAVVLPGLATAGLAWLATSRARGHRPGSPGRRPAPGPAGVGRWAVMVALAAAWQLGAYLQHPRDDHPTISSLTNAALDSHTARAAAFLAWLAATVVLIRR